jgi:hypothetical protein
MTPIVNRNINIRVRSQVITAVSMKIRDLWDVATCSLGTDRRFRGAYYLYFIGLIIKAVRTSETSVCTNESKRQYIPEGSNLLD